ncbi:hypothetical protein KFL_002150100 [Klebsormidium nitens]|uniref:Peptidase S1 domain-containing protein n=1 Tax=Klebsormidium nitens TaxID=105231 RepID=A0A1Y1I232_KLENI|nr:hypothetical protein KFL_002150100 [Klebsormidium nitens]|eukprot:GAQ84974.1 hypothetical protein KFL_002150100 [Klebsormidium nitens]
MEGCISYFITPAQQKLIGKSIFYIVEDEEKELESRAVGIFYSTKKAVTADHCLSDNHVIGNTVLAKLPGETLKLEVVFRCPELDYAILQSTYPHERVSSRVNRSSGSA